MNEPRLEDLFSAYRDRHDATALARVFDATAPALVAVARKLTHRRSDAEDLVQSTFVTVITRAETYDASRPLVPWLVGILAGHARNLNRREARRDEYARSPKSSPLGRSRDTLDELVELEARAAVAKSLFDLPATYRELLGARLAGIEEPLPGVSPGTLRVRLHRGIARLRALLPKSLFGLAISTTSDRRALASLRGRFLELASPSAVPPRSLLLLGDTLVKSKLAWIAGIAVLAATWFALENFEGESPRTEAPSATPVAISEQSEDSSLARTDATADRSTVPQESTAAPGSESTPARPPAIALRGRVVDATSGSPIGGAECDLFLAAPPSKSFDSHPVRSDSSGRFTLELSEFHERPWLAVRSANYAPTRKPLRIHSPGIALRNGVDIGDVPLVRGARVRGRVLDSAGGAVANAQLMLRDLPDRHPVFYPVEAHPVGTSLADGTFVLENVAPSGGFSFSLFAYSERGVGCARLEVGTGSELASTVTVRLEPLASLVVVVLDAGGAPVPDAVVAALPLCEPFLPTPWDREIGVSFEDVVTASGVLLDPRVPPPFRAVTDEMGRVRFATLPADRRLVLTANAPGSTRFVDYDVRASGSAPNARRIELAPERVFRIAGRVVDAQRAPVANAVIERQDEAGEFRPARHFETTSDPMGRFQFDDVPGGTTTKLRVRAEGRSSSPTRFTLPLDRGREDVELVAATVVPLRGKIVDDRGAPIFDAAISCVPLGQDEDGTKRQAAPEVRSDGDGVFRVAERTHGRWTIEVVLPGPPEDWREARLEQVVGENDRELLFTARHATKPTLAEVRIAVVDPATHEAIDLDGAVAWQIDEQGLVRDSRIATEVRRGLARFEDCPVGLYRAEIRPQGRSRTTVDFRVTAADLVVNATVEAPRSARVRGRIVADGLDPTTFAEGLQQSRVVGFDGRGLPTYAGEFDPAEVPLLGSSEFEFSRIPSTTISLRLLGKLRGSVVLEAKPGNDLEVVIRARAFGTVSTRGASDFPDGTLAIRCFRPDAVDEWTVIHYRGAPSAETKLELTSGHWEYTLHFATGAGAFVPFFDLPTIGGGNLEVVANQEVDLVLVPPAK